MVKATWHQSNAALGVHKMLLDDGFNQAPKDGRIYSKVTPGDGRLLIGVSVDDIWIRQLGSGGERGSSQAYLTDLGRRLCTARTVRHDKFQEEAARAAPIY